MIGWYFTLIFVNLQSMVTVELPCKRSIRNYLEVHYGKPVKFPPLDDIGDYFYLLLADDDNSQGSRTGYYPDAVTVLITEKVLLKRGFVMTPTNLVQFNNWLLRRIKREMILYIETAIKYSAMANPDKRIFKRQIYDNFIDEFGLESSAFTYDAVKKDHERWHNRKLSLGIV